MTKLGPLRPDRDTAARDRQPPWLDFGGRIKASVWAESRGMTIGYLPIASKIAPGGTAFVYLPGWNPG